MHGRAQPANHRPSQPVRPIRRQLQTKQVDLLVHDRPLSHPHRLSTSKQVFHALCTLQVVLEEPYFLPDFTDMLINTV